MFIKTLQVMLRKDLTHKSVKLKDLYQLQKIKIVTWLRNNKLDGKIVIEFVGPRWKLYFYFIDVYTEVKKATKNKKQNSKTIKNVYKIILRSKQRFKSDTHNVFAEKVHKIVSRFNDDKVLQHFNKVKSYLYGKIVGKVWKEELLKHVKANKSNIKDD